MNWTKEKIKLIEKSSKLFVENRKLKRIIFEQDVKLSDLYAAELMYEQMMDLSFKKPSLENYSFYNEHGDLVTVVRTTSKKCLVSEEGRSDLYFLPKEFVEAIYYESNS